MHRIWPLPAIAFLPLAEIEESRPVALVCSGPAWDAVRDRLDLSIAWRADVRAATLAHWQDLGNDLRGDVIYAVGGGLAVDAAKYLAAQHNLPLISLPTALSVDAFFTCASGVRRDGCVKYIETTIPDRVIVDFDVIAAAPPSIRAAGICDVLSIATGLWDWKYAEEKGMNPPETAYVPWVAQTAEAILRGALACAEAAGRGDPAGLKQLLDCLALEVQLCNQIGHARPEEGSEHYFAYAVENLMGRGLPHGDLVGPGILLMARLQGQNTSELQRALEECHIPLQNIPAEVVAATLRQLPDYCRRHQLAYGLAHDLTEAVVERIVD